MLVEMVKLRQSGRKFTREELRGRTPVRGDLSIYIQREMLVAAVLPEKRLPDDIPTLEEPRLTRMTGDSFVLVGFERISKRRSGDHERYAQAWWCRLPRESAWQAESPQNAPSGRVIDYA